MHGQEHVPTAVIGLLGAAVATCVLHLAGDRHGAAALALIGPVWALLAVASARRTDVHLLFIGLVALATRLVLVGTPPLLSDDLYRYLWEGHVLNAGGNPFTTPPSAIIGLDDSLRSLVNHPDIPSIYPPLALVWFRMLDAIADRAFVAQAAASLADVGTAMLIGLAARTRIGAAWPGLLYAAHPLAVLESGSSAHLEAPAVLLLTAAVVAHDRRWPTVSGFLWALGAGTKVFPASVGPAFRQRNALLGAGLGLIVVGLAAIPVLGAGPALLTAFTNYNRHWSFNGFTYPWLGAVVGTYDRPLLVLIGVGTALYAHRVRRDPVDVWLMIAAAFLFLTPTAHPWYGLWALAPALITGRRDWALALGWSTVSYAVLSTIDAAGVWREPWWLWPVTWLPIVLALTASAMYPAAISARNGTDAG